MVAELGQVIQGQAAYEAGRYNRDVARVNATNVEREGAAEEADIREAAAAAMGRQAAAQAEGGFQAGTGSALDALRESAVAMTVDVLRTRRRAGSQASAIRAGGDMAMAEGRNARTGAYFAAAGSLIKKANYAGG